MCLSSLFNGAEDVDGESLMDIDQLAFLICRGGWPEAIGLSDKDALGQAFDYFDIVTDSDVSRVDGVVRDPLRVRLLMRSYARHQGAGASVGTILADIKTNDSSELSDNTVYDYIKALKRTFVIEDMPAWNPNIRSKTAIRTSDTRYFIDPCIGTAALGLGPNDLLNDLETMGLMFETLCIRDLRVYAESIDGSVYHYRDKNGLECDASDRCRQICLSSPRWHFCCPNQLSSQFKSHININQRRYGEGQYESNAIGIKSLLDGAVHFPVTNFSNASNFSRSRGSALISSRLPCWSNSLYVGNEFTLR